LFDNLRRSLVPAALTLLLLLGWNVLPQAGFWTLTVIAILVIPWAAVVVLDLLRKPAEVLARQHLGSVAGLAGRHAAQTLLAVAFLSFEAVVYLDAIARTAWRMLVTRRRLLEWNPSASDDPASRRSMWIAPVIAAATAILLALSNPYALPFAAPILLLWLASPLIAWWVG